jgi:D-beta-D-heptose 7-phosphate kinase/D-beta-D-heptose 1-phosphate adenosyltransferase
VTSADIVALRGARVFVAGDALLDVYLQGDVARISPEAPVPVLLESDSRHVLGGSANVAANIAALGGLPMLAARVGADPEGDALRALCDEQGIERSALVSEPGIPTPRKTRVVAGFQQLARLDRECTEPLGIEGQERVLRCFEAWLRTGDGHGALVLADYAKGSLPSGLVRALIDRARAAVVPIIVDPKARDLGRYRGATVIKPNRAEAQEAAAASGVESLCDAVLDASGAENVVLSLSAAGVSARGQAVDGTLRLRSRALQVADVSGAGDTMVAVLALALARRMDLARGVELANAAAGAVCAKLGTATLSTSELVEAVDGRRPKVLAERAGAVATVEQLRSDGRRVVFANGCFDLLHAGHVRLLRHARSLGDALLVALNDDDSVRRLKGEGRPRQPLEDRMEVLAALECVDFVTSFGEDTPRELILALRPAVIVKGSDYRAQDVVGGAEARAWGGEVAIVPLLEGRSTTRLLGAAG